MKIRIIGNSCSGKTTVARKLGEYFNTSVLHMDGIAFVPNSDFELRDNEFIKKDLSTFIISNENWIVEGNYLSVFSSVFNVPDIIIFIDLPIDQSLYNFENRFKQYSGKSRPELPNLIETDKQEMINWISSYPERRFDMTSYILEEQMQNPLVNILHIEDMSEVVAISNNPNLIEGFYQ